IVSDGVPFDVGAAAQLRMDWETKRAALAAPLREQFSTVKNINSRPQLGALLESQGWVPAKRTPKTKKPVIDDELLESLPATYPEFAGLAEYFVIGRRLGQLATGKQAWIDAVGSDGRLHGGLVHIGTPHSRAKHLGPNLAQVPNHKRGGVFAVECRRLFRHPGDWVFVTCDQGNLQDRGFAHYLSAFDGGTYARTFIEGVDQHWTTALALELVAQGTTRDKTNEAHNAIREKGGKRFRYAFLFGAGGLKLGQIVAGAGTFRPRPITSRSTALSPRAKPSSVSAGWSTSTASSVPAFATAPTATPISRCGSTTSLRSVAGRPSPSRLARSSSVMPAKPANLTAFACRSRPSSKSAAIGQVPPWRIEMQIIRTTAKLPPIIVLHGQPGIGKTTLAQNFPAPVFIQTEDGCPSGLEIDTFGLLDSYAGVINAIKYLGNELHEYKTVVLDSLDKFEPQVLAAVCADRGFTSIESPGFGKGWVMADQWWLDFL